MTAASASAHTAAPSLTRKILLGLAALAALWIVTIVVVVSQFRRVETQVAELTLVTQPLAAAASALEVSALGTGAAVLRYLADSTPESRDAIALRVAETRQDLARLTGLGGPALRPLVDRFAERFHALSGSGERLIALREREAMLARDFARSLAVFDHYLDDEFPRLDSQATDRVAFQARLVTLRSELVRVVGRLSAQVGAAGLHGADPALPALIGARQLLLEAAQASAGGPLAGWMRRVGDEMGRLAEIGTAATQVRARLRAEADRFGSLRDATADLLANEMHTLVNARVASVDAEVRGAIGNGLTLAIGFAVALALASAALLVLFSRKIVRPLAALAAGAARVGAGDFATAVPAAAARDEMGRLVAAFNAMMARVSATQRALTDHAATLDDAVRARTADLEQANAALKNAVTAADRANAAKSAFLAAMSHELRTPLNAIIGFSEVIAGQLLGKGKDEHYRGYARDIHGSGLHLLGIVNDLLDMVKIEAGKLELNLEDLVVGEVVDEAVAMLQSRVADAMLSCEVAVDADTGPIAGDRRIVKQVLLNLLANAIKFTPAAGRITVTAHREGGFAAIAVADSGIGMTAEQVAHAVEPFYQADDKLSRKYEGTGLGLTLVKAFVERHGGTMTIASEPNIGTTVTVRLPLAEVAALEQAAD
jgi:signal transduction histidine kinase